MILRGLTDNTVGPSARRQVGSLINKQRAALFSPHHNSYFHNSLRETTKLSLFIPEIQVFVLKGEFAHAVWRPDGGAQHSEHTLLQERCACGTQHPTFCVVFKLPTIILF